MVFSSPRTRVCETLVCSSRTATLACSVAGGLFKSLFCSLSTFSPNSPLPQDHLTGTTRSLLSTAPQRASPVWRTDVQTPSDSGTRSGSQDQDRAGRARICAQGLPRGSRLGRAGDSDSPAFRTRVPSGRPSILTPRRIRR